MIIDAKNMIAGRIATVAAKNAILGEDIIIVNSESAIITGKKQFLVSEYTRRKEQGTFKGPFLPKMPDRFLKRLIRGMLPYKKEKGSTALERIKCYIGVPAEFADKEIVKIENADMKKLDNRNYMNIGDICKKIGWKGK